MAFYVAANAAFNVFVARVIVRGSAVAMYAATTAAVPVAYVALAFYQGEAGAGTVGAFAPYNFGGLAVVLAGIVLYNAYLSDWSYRHVCVLGHCVTFGANLLDFVWVSRWHVSLGVDDRMFLLGLDVVQPVVSKIAKQLLNSENVNRM